MLEIAYDNTSMWGCCHSRHRQSLPQKLKKKSFTEDRWVFSETSLKLGICQYDVNVIANLTLNKL